MADGQYVEVEGRAKPLISKLTTFWTATTAERSGSDYIERLLSKSSGRESPSSQEYTHPSEQHNDNP